MSRYKDHKPCRVHVVRKALKPSPLNPHVQKEAFQLGPGSVLTLNPGPLTRTLTLKPKPRICVESCPTSNLTSHVCFDELTQSTVGLSVAARDVGFSVSGFGALGFGTLHAFLILAPSRRAWEVLCVLPKLACQAVYSQSCVEKRSTTQPAGFFSYGKDPLLHKVLW